MLALLLALAAAVTPAPGVFQGRTSQHRAMRIVVRHGWVVGNAFELRFRCTDGYRDVFGISRPHRARVVGGAFNVSWNDTSRLGYRYTATIAGSFPSRRRAIGTVSLGINRSDHGGACTTGRVHWAAVRRAAG